MFRRCSRLFCANLPTVAISERCSARVAEVNKMNNWDPPKALRLKVVTGGCQGFSYEFAFDDHVNPEKDVALAHVPEGAPITVEGVGVPKVVIDKKSITKLQGATIDYHCELKGSAFVVIGNELVDQSCACGQSFSMIKQKRKEREARAAKLAKRQEGETVADSATAPSESEAAPGPTVHGGTKISLKK